MRAFQSIFVALFLLLFSATVWSQSSLKRSSISFSRKAKKKEVTVIRSLYKKGLVFSSALMLKRHLQQRRRLTKSLEKLMVKLILTGGMTSFAGLRESVFEYYRKSPAISYIFGLKLFQMGKIEESIEALKKIPSSHPLAPESYLIFGAASLLKKKYATANRYYTGCWKLAERGLARSQNRSSQIYFTSIGEKCMTHRARLFYERKEYEKALDAWALIPKTSSEWPYLLLEKAWAYYQIKDYNRVLGLLTTYNSPLLKSYFLPETEVLKALSYVKLCLWGESNDIVKAYHTDHLKVFKQMKKILIRHKDSSTYFLKLMSISPERQEKLNPFIRNLAVRIGKRPRFVLEFFALKKLTREYKSLRKSSSTKTVRILRKSLRRLLVKNRRYLNSYVKMQMFSFLAKMRYFAHEMSNINLKIISQKREGIYRGEDITNERLLGSLENVQRTSQQYFYSFDGEFWADELGDYSFGLKSNCREQQKEGNDDEE
ncbi:MAG: hypothetical protein OXB88_11295 [Bacteriovoracales bacterium]|nr:hypothetical protein [Bacteriovoracales bacterium]